MANEPKYVPTTSVDSPARAVSPVSEQEYKKIEYDTSDEDLVRVINDWMKESSNLHDELLRIQTENEEYYKGNQTKKDQIPAHQSNAVDNRIFTSIETIIPIVTTNPPQWMCIPAQENEVSNELAESTQAMLQVNYDTKMVKDKLREGIRYMTIYRMGIWKIFWDEEINDVNLKAIRPQRVWIPPFGKSVDELPYIIEKIDMTFDEIEDVFGKEALKRVSSTSPSPEDNKHTIERVRTIWEVWTDDVVIWKYGTEILKKLPNPYWDWEGTQDEEIDDLRFFNHFAKPKKPYVIKSPFTLGNSIVGESDLIQQAIPLQDIVNTNLRQITNNANKIGNPRLLIDPQVMTEEQTSFITNAPGQIIMGDGIADPSKFRYEDVPALPNYIFENMLNAKSEIDNVMGTHSTTRGERGESETLGGRILLRQQDLGRIGDIVGLLESAVTEIGNWFVQLFKMYYTTKRTVRLYGENGVKFIQFSRDNIEDGLEIIVKAGSTLPVDEISKRNEALELWQMGVLDPITLYERLKFPDPRETAQRLVLWQTGQLVQGQPLPMEQAGQPGGMGAGMGAGIRQPTPQATQTGTQEEKSRLSARGNKIREFGGQ